MYAVPGRLTDRLSDGCNLLIRQGAGIALTPEDILAELAVLQNRKGPKEQKRGTGQNTKEMNKEDKEMGVLAYLDEYPRPADEILEAMRQKGISMELPRLLEELICLCMENKARQVGGSYFSKVSFPEDSIVL